MWKRVEEQDLHPASVLKMVISILAMCGASSAPTVGPYAAKLFAAAPMLICVSSVGVFGGAYTICVEQ